MKYFQFAVLLLAVFSQTKCAKILGVFHVAGRSHYQAGASLMRILAEKGHDVTVVSPFGEKNAPKNYRDVHLSGVWEKMQKQKFDGFGMQSDNSLLSSLIGFFISPIFFTSMASQMVEDLYNNTNFQNLMNSGEKFDLVIMEQFNSEAVKYVAHHFNAPLIVYNALETNEWINPYQGNPSNPSYLPLIESGYTNHMTFFQRVRNTISYTYGELVRHFYTLAVYNRLLHKYYPDAPDLSEISYNVSLVFVNTDPSTHSPLPRVPSIISIGGFHIRKPKPLPQDLQNILDNAKNGVVYFSMGSNLNSKDIPKEKRDMIMRIFGKLNETVIWKFEDENLPGKPDNVIIRSWLPQNDIFAHKNVKVFITHGGIHGTMESIYHGLPMLAIPIFGDQQLNAKRATASGYAQWLDFDKMTEEEFQSKLNDLLTDPKYTENVKKRSVIMRDKPISQQDSINYWAEYVIRHKGADHLRVAALSLSWYQYLLLDVVIFIILVSLALIMVSVYSMKMILQLFKKKRQSKLKGN